MSQNISKRERLFVVTVVFGSAAVRPFIDGEYHTSELERLGKSKTYRFHTRAEKHAFMMGVEHSTGFHDSLFIEV